MSTTDSTITTTLSPQPSAVHNKIPNEPTPPSAVVSESQPVVVSEPSKAQQQTSTSEAMVNDQVKHKEIDKDGHENRKVESLIPQDTSQNTGEKQNVVRQGEQIILSSSTKDQTRYSNNIKLHHELRLHICGAFEANATQTRNLSMLNVRLLCM